MAGWEGGDSGAGGRGEAQKDFLLEGADFSAAPAAAFSVPSGPQQLLSALSPSLSSLLLYQVSGARKNSLELQLLLVGCDPRSLPTSEPPSLMEAVPVGGCPLPFVCLPCHSEAGSFSVIQTA